MSGRVGLGAFGGNVEAMTLDEVDARSLAEWFAAGNPTTPMSPSVYDGSPYAFACDNPSAWALLDPGCWTRLGLDAAQARTAAAAAPRPATD